MAQKKFIIDGGFLTDEPSIIQAELDMDNNKIVNVIAPTNDTDVANKASVDAAQAAAEATAAADATAKANAAQSAAEATAQAYTDAREAVLFSAIITEANGAVTTANTYTDSAVANVINGAPGALDTLNELAAALGDDANFASTVTNSLSTKASITYVDTQVATAATTGKAIAMAIVFG